MATDAKKVYDFERGIVFDRTKETHHIGLFDVDFLGVNSPNPVARQWTYGTSHKTLPGAIKGAKKLRDNLENRASSSGPVRVRVVNSLSGEVLWGGE